MNVQTAEFSFQIDCRFPAQSAINLPPSRPLNLPPNLQFNLQFNLQSAICNLQC